MNAPSRREFVATGIAACACALCPAARVRAAASRPTDVGTPADFSRDGAYDKWADQGFFIVRRGNRLYALTSTCSHKDVQIVLKNQALRCPKHGSVFSLEGNVKKAPARDPLDRYAISLDAGGRVVVDPAERFERDRWGDAKCFVQLP